MPRTPPTSNTSTPESQRTKKGIREPRETDVLCGRGGSINSHPGNETFRQLVDQQKIKYITSKTKRDKRSIAQSIVSAIGDLRPPGRFLRKDGDLWYLVDTDKARDKTSQALRENAPKMRREIEEEQQLQQKEQEEQQQTDEDEEGDGSQVKEQHQDEDEDGRMYNNMAQYHSHSRHHPQYHRPSHHRQMDHYYPTRDHSHEYHGEYFQQRHHQRRPTQYNDRRHHNNYGPPQRRRDVMYDKSDMYYTEEKEDRYHSARRPHHPYYNHEEEKVDRPPPTYHPQEQQYHSHHHNMPNHPQNQQNQEDEDVSMQFEPIADWRNTDIDFRDPSFEKDKVLVGSMCLALTKSSSLTAYPDGHHSTEEPSSTGHHPNMASATPPRSNTGSSMDSIVHRLPSQSTNHEDYHSPTRSSHAASSHPYAECTTSMDQSMSMGQVSSSHTHRRHEPMHTGSMMQVSYGSKPSNITRGGVDGQEVELLDALADSMDCDDDEDDTNLIEGNKDENRIPPSPSSPISSLLVQHQNPPLVTSKSSTPSPLSPPSIHSTSNNICYSIFSDMLFSSDSLSSGDQIMDRQSSLGSLCGPSLYTAFEENEATIPKSGGGVDVQGQHTHHKRDDSEKTFSDNSMASLKDIMLQNSADLLHKLDSA